MPHLAHRVNQNQDSDIAIRPGLVKDGLGYALDIFDCTGGFSCEKFQEKQTRTRDLPHMVKNLQPGAGILAGLHGRRRRSKHFFSLKIENKCDNHRTYYMNDHSSF